MANKKRTHPLPRNLLHDHPLLRKGAVHAKSRKALRRAGKVAIRHEWDGQNASASVAPVLLAA